ncbi:hypothetical protein [Haloplasma contractile]|uniref:Uncharacterized protein n=1 Tax=Haloplasma contractile SSD-17B TaxID=1033810 RepID=U2E9W7_9MOLU|nr:hypothetical protein [Haloplasma contractile]ERJ11636.1 hypothetical protein HLPCO_002337 [Haloplasma contractile SSD-17B]
MNSSEAEKNHLNKKNLSKNITWIGFYMLVLVLFINVIIMTLYLMNSNYEYRIFNHAYTEAVLPDQDINQVMKTDIVQIERYNLKELEPGTEVVMCCDYQIDIPWVERVVDKDMDSNQIETTYDGLLSTTVSEDHVYGVFIKEASILGTIYYSSSFLTGYLYLVASHTFLVLLYYVLILGRKSERVKSHSK